VGLGVQARTHRVVRLEARQRTQHQYGARQERPAERSRPARRRTASRHTLDGLGLGARSTWFRHTHHVTPITNMDTLRVCQFGVRLGDGPIPG
jgi:hypothetical protein